MLFTWLPSPLCLQAYTAYKELKGKDNKDLKPGDQPPERHPLIQRVADKDMRAVSDWEYGSVLRGRKGPGQRQACLKISSF